VQRLICNQHLIAVLDKVERSNRQRARSRSKAMVTVKSSQKIFTDSKWQVYRDLHRAHPISPRAVIWDSSRALQKLPALTRTSGCLACRI